MPLNVVDWLQLTHVHWPDGVKPIQEESLIESLLVSLIIPKLIESQPDKVRHDASLIESW